MSRWWKANLWKIVLFPALLGLIAVGYSLLQGAAHHWLGFDSQGRPVENGTAPVIQTAPTRRAIPVTEVLADIRADLDRAELRQRPQRRYLTLIHRHNDPSVSEAELQLERHALADLVAVLAQPGRVATVTAIDAEKLVFRLDLTAVDWPAEQWRQVAVLYPYGLSYETVADEGLRDLDKEIRRATDERVPLVRADWFLVALSRPPLGGAAGSLWRGTLPEKVQLVVRAYDGQPLDLNAAARELGINSQALQKLLTQQDYLREEFGLAPLDAGKTIPRDGWETDRNLVTPFQELSKCLGLGKPIRLR